MTRGGAGSRWWRPRRLSSVVALALLVIVTGSSQVGCARTPDRLPNLDRRFYALLPTPTEQEAFLRERKDEQRRELVKSSGLWAKWLSLPPEQREAAAAGVVRPGFDEFALFMAWGPPADTQQRDAVGRGVPSLLHTFIRCSSGPRAGRYVRDNLECDGTSEETQVAVQDGVVTEIRYPH